MSTPSGFICADQFGSNETRRIMFVDYKGKDIAFNRWRFDLYYAPHLAMCHFEQSEADAERFKRNARACFEDYTEYRKSTGTWGQS